MAAFANDPAMIADYVAEPYLSFAKRAGLLPDGASADVTAQVREIAKPCVLGQMYGMTYIGLARKTKKSQMWARDTIARFHSMYALFVRWQGDTVAQAKFDRRIRSPYGWSMQVNGTTKHRTLMDWPAQAAGGDALRLTMVAAMKAGITVCGPVHDAVWVLAPLDALDATLATMRDIMRRAGLAVTGGRLEIGTKLEACVRYPNSYGDVRKPHETGQAMWLEIQELVSRLRQQKGLK